MALRLDNIGQTTLIPTDVTSVIPGDHICYFIAYVASLVNFNEIEENYKHSKGMAAYSRRMLLRVVIMASIKGIFSSRKIENEIRENIVFMYLSGGDQPDFRTIARFKQECKDQIEETFEMTVKIAKKLKIVQLNYITVDGTIMKANASNSKLINQKEITTVRELIEKGIEADIEEDKIHGDKKGDEELSRLSNREKVDEAIQEYQKEKQKSGKKIKLRKASHQLLEEALTSEKGKEQVLKKLDNAEKELKTIEKEDVSLTDTKSRFMKNKKGKTELSYNIQLAVDHSSGIILANNVTQEANDQYQLIPVIEEVENNIEELPKNMSVLGDNGYHNNDNIEYLEDKGLQGYIPNRKLATLAKKDISEIKPFHKHKFQYNYQNNSYTCPNNIELPYKNTYKEKDKVKHVYYTSECSKCPYKEECAGKNRIRVITDYATEPTRRMAQKMETKEGQEIFAKRKESAEWPFGHVKYNLKFTEFYTRGTTNTENETNIISTAHNIKRIYNIQNQSNSSKTWQTPKTYKSNNTNNQNNKNLNQNQTKYKKNQIPQKPTMTQPLPYFSTFSFNLRVMSTKWSACSFSRLNSFNVSNRSWSILLPHRSVYI